MRIRKRKWEEEELSRFERYIKNPKQFKGNWKKVFGNDNQIHIEIGMGKGMFLSKLAKAGLDKNTNINYIGIDVEDTMLAISKRAIENEYFNFTFEDRINLNEKINKIRIEYLKIVKEKEAEVKIQTETKAIETIEKNDESIESIELKGIKGIKGFEEYLKTRLTEKENRIYNIIQLVGYKKENYPNICITRQNADYIMQIFDKKDNITRIYLNFSNPWPKDKHNKRRLTHTTKLKQYLEFLNSPFEIYFKTDDKEFFDESLEYFKELKFEIVKITYDLAKEDIFGGNIETEHEKMFKAENKKINAVIIKKEE